MVLFVDHDGDLFVRAEDEASGCGVRRQIVTDEMPLEEKLTVQERELSDLNRARIGQIRQAAHCVENTIPEPRQVGFQRAADEAVTRDVPRETNARRKDAIGASALQPGMDRTMSAVDIMIRFRIRSPDRGSRRASAAIELFAFDGA
jgi:hypothetical protein